MDKIAVLVPCYNEAQTIKTVIEDWKNALPEATVYVYDNNSTDNTASIAEKAGAVVRYEYKQGKGSVIRRMFREIDAEVYVMVDGDNTYSSASAKEMVALIQDGKADMVVGDRLSSTYFSENKRPFHNIGNRLVRGSINLLFDSNVLDVMTGCRAFSQEFVKSFPVLSQGFEIETEMTIHALDKGMRIVERPVWYKDRPEGSFSKLNTIKDGIKVLSTIVSLFQGYKPLTFYSVLSLVLCIISTCFFVPVFTEYLATDTVLNFPTLIVCCFVYLAAIISFFSGLILHNLVKQDKRSYELYLLHYRR